MRGSPPNRAKSTSRAGNQNILRQTLHQRAAGTLLSGKRTHPPRASPGLPCNCCQLAHVWPCAYLGFALEGSRSRGNTYCPNESSGPTDRYAVVIGR